MFSVVLATDSPWVEEDVRTELDGPDFDLTVVDSGRAAVEAVLSGRVDVAVLDMQVGSMGAPAMVAEIRNDLNDRVASTPAVCLLDRAADAWICKKMGADECLLKPFEPGSLKRAVRRLAGRDRVGPGVARTRKR